MGNCLIVGKDGRSEAIKVITSNGGVMEFSAPITAGSIANEFPGHAIYTTHDLFLKPLTFDEELTAGNSYYLLPLRNNAIKNGGKALRQGHARSKSTPASASFLDHVTPCYRMSFDYHHQGMLKRAHAEAFSSSRYGGSNHNDDGFWKVKLVISPDRLVKILSQEDQIQELIENMRAVAKCGNGSSSSSAGGFSSDQWSFSSSRNGSSKKDELLEL